MPSSAYSPLKSDVWVWKKRTFYYLWVRNYRIKFKTPSDTRRNEGKNAHKIQRLPKLFGVLHGVFNANIALVKWKWTNMRLARYYQQQHKPQFWSESEIKNLNTSNRLNFKSCANGRRRYASNCTKKWINTQKYNTKKWILKKSYFLPFMWINDEVHRHLNSIWFSLLLLILRLKSIFWIFKWHPVPCAFMPTHKMWNIKQDFFQQKRTKANR